MSTRHSSRRRDPLVVDRELETRDFGLSRDEKLQPRKEDIVRYRRPQVIQIKSGTKCHSGTKSCIVTVIGKTKDMENIYTVLLPGGFIDWCHEKDLTPC